MSREAFEARYDKSRLRRWSGGIYPDEYSDPQVQLDWNLWQAAQADAFERAAMVCKDQWYAADCAEAIRALAKEPKQ